MAAAPQGYSKGAQDTPLTAEQSEAYVRHAREASARQSEFDQARNEMTRADRGRRVEPDRDPLQAKPGRELSERPARLRRQRARDQRHG
jgi:hypothetical protein